jgi:prepilin-type processing-associated H-X9-DG protein/prepilin-type N-terminal cleavage/methylation domain-containing protein
MREQSRSTAFTLIELLLVIAIVGVLLGLTAAAVQRVRVTASRARCQNQLRQIGLSLHNYHDTQGALPPGVSYLDNTDPFPFMSWLTRLLPYLEEQARWTEARQAFAQDRNFLDDPPHALLSSPLTHFACPADGRAGAAMQLPSGRTVAFTSYLGMEGRNQFSQDGVLFLDSKVRLVDIRDGTSVTLMVGERPPSANGKLGWWYAGWGQGQDGSGDMVLGVREKNIGVAAPGCPAGPYHFVAGRFNNQCDAFHFWSPHPGGANFAFADGSVHFLSYSADSILPALATRAGGEVVSLPD